MLSERKSKDYLLNILNVLFRLFNKNGIKVDKYYTGNQDTKL